MTAMRSAEQTQRWWKRWLGAPEPEGVDTGPQVRVIHWSTASTPSRVVVKAGRPVLLVLERREPSCASDFLAIPALGWVTTLGHSVSSAIEVGPFAAGAYDFSSVDGAVEGCLVVEP